MPPTLVNVQIPVISLSSDHKLKYKPRIYGEEPLPIKPSEHAPRQARIIGRIAEPDRVAYTLEVGGVRIDDVRIDEVLDYVSPYDLEQFENGQFQEEREILRLAQEQAELEAQQRRERQRLRAKTKGTVIFEDSDDDSSESDDMNEAVKHGRARPTYTHLFKQNTAFTNEILENPEKRRRRKRHPVTGELMPLSDHEDEDHSGSGRTEGHGPMQSKRRRRRKRDPDTGELLPLEPVPQSLPASYKRPRRKRHPVTGELMPLGWHYDPEAEKATKLSEDAAGSNLQSMHRLSISQEHNAKRIKLTSEYSNQNLSRNLGSNRNAKPLVNVSITPNISDTDDDMEISDSEDPVEAFKRVQSPSSSFVPKTSIVSPTAQPAPRPPPKESKSPGPITLASFLEASRLRADSETSEETSDGMDIPKSPERPRTSILNPTAINLPSNGEDSGSEEKEWYVEAILGHALSDPKKTPGKKPVMLYSVKWEGFDELTWEPIDSFPDKSIVREYRLHVGLHKHSGKAQKAISSAVDSATAASHRPLQALQAKSNDLIKSKVPVIAIESDKDDQEGDDDDDEDGYEVEAILNHHMSDPRSHPGRPAVMLYQVKWVGYEELTWEPGSSFTDASVLGNYKKSVGLK